jgi:hypothetical protein
LKKISEKKVGPTIYSSQDADPDPVKNRPDLKSCFLLVVLAEFNFQFVKIKNLGLLIQNIKEKFL